MRHLAVDPGEKHIGLAVSDPFGLIASPLSTLRHESREIDARRIAALADEHQAGLIIVGWALDEAGQPGPQARRAERLADAIRAASQIPVRLHDESLSTQTARERLRDAGRSRRTRRDRIHAAAAAAVLQSFLDANPPETPPHQP